MKIKLLLSLSLLLLGSIASHAGGVTKAKVTGVYCGYYNGTNMCSVYFDKIIVGSPSCATSSGGTEQKYRFQFRLDEVGKGILAIALSAQTQGAFVEATGINSCSIWGDTESLNVLFMTPPNYPTFP